MRVALIDDDEWVRRGRAAALTDAGVEVAYSCDHSGALAIDENGWRGIETVLVDAHDDRCGFDQYPGVAVVQHLRTLGESAPTIVVVTGHVLDDMLRLRMAEAGADYLFGHTHVRTVEQLLDVISDPAAHAIDMTPDPTRLATLGLDSKSRPNAALAWVTESGMRDVFEAAESGESQKTYDVSRRQLSRARERIAEIAQVRRTASGTRTALPEWQQIVDLVAAMRGRSENPPPG